MPEYVPSIATLRERAAQLIGRQVGRGELKSMMAAICAAKNAGTPIPPDSTGQTWITESQGIINQADQDALAILVREFAEFVENAGGGGGGDAPAVIAPFPGVGAEGEYYAQQVRTTGATPQTFTVTTGAIPTGMTLNNTSGIMTGTCQNPNGGLYAGTITVTNAAGSATYDFNILVTGELPETAYATGPFNAINFPLVSGDIVATALEPYTLTPSVATGSVGGSPATPITYNSYVAGSDPGLVCDQATGDLAITASSEIIGNVYDWFVGSTNYFGQTNSETRKLAIVAPIYYGEWHGALPGTFTAADITAGLYNDTTPGPRIIEGTAVWDTFSDYGVPVWPTTAVAYYRVIAIPRGLLSGTIARTTVGYGETVAPTDYSTVTLSDFTPPWPATYQAPLAISGIDYDVYVLDGGPTTAGYTMVWRAGVSPNGPTLSVSNLASQTLMYVGDANFRYAGAENDQHTEIELTLASDLPVTYSTSGSLPTGLSWIEGTLTISGTPTSNDDVFERFVFTVTASNAYGSSSVTLIICISAPIYWGELPGALPGSFTASDITDALQTNGVPGPTVLPNSTVHGAPPGTYTMSTPAIGFNGVVLPGFYGHYDNATAYYPATFYFNTFTSGYGNPDPPKRIIAVPSKFFSGSWAKDPFNTGANYVYALYEYALIPMPSFTPPAVVGFGGAKYIDTPYQSGLIIPSNGVNVSYMVLVCQPYINIYGYATALKFVTYNDV